MIPPSLAAQQPYNFVDGAPGQFGHGPIPAHSPGLPTSLQHSMHPPPFSLNTPTAAAPPLRTPMQPAFFPHGPPPAPGRPAHGHRGHPSIAQLAALGIVPPPMPQTPLGHVGFPPPLLGMNAGLAPYAHAPPFVPRSKRTPSVSVGGPPKAVLGGPQRKVSPVPPAATPAVAVVQKAKKVVVKLPKETIRNEELEEGTSENSEQSEEVKAVTTTRPSWARTPLRPEDVPVHPEVPEPEIVSAEVYPSDPWRMHLPATVDVFLPGKGAWDTIKRSIIEEKLEKLGVERGSGSNIPHIHAPHARAASISSPADPALLYFKLHKLQQSQNASATASLSTSPQPPFNLTPSPQIPPRFQNRHGHSMSLAHPLPAHSPVYNPAAAYNPFGPNATLGSDQMFAQISRGPLSAGPDNIIAPQGRVPANFATLAPPPTVSRPESRPDFLRGFGLDVTEEEEEPEEAAEREDGEVELDSTHATANTTVREEIGDFEPDGTSTVAASRVHSRHVSRLSAALSLASVGGMADETVLASSPRREVVPEQNLTEDVEVDDVDALGTWTGSEDLRTGEETSEDESIGEWSNPSDEERARHQRLQRRMLRRAKEVQQDLVTPRRLPEFPLPPSSMPAFGSAPADDDIISNPSEEGRAPAEDSFLGLETDDYYSRPASNLSSRSRPLPPVPHSRTGSAQYSYHDPALAHSRSNSEHNFIPLQPRPLQPASGKETLNPLAKPFVFGTSRPLAATAPAFVPSTASPPVSLLATSHSRGPSSASKRLNAAAQEFKPTGFTFLPPPGVPQLAFSTAPPAPVSRPLPTPPSPALPATTPARATQGREKRQRRGSATSLDGDDEDGVNNMSTFKFPPPGDTVRAVSAPASPPTGSAMKELSANTSHKLSTFSGFSNSMPSTQQQLTSSLPRTESPEPDEDQENRPPTQMEPEDGESTQELPFPPASLKPKRAPIPLDFKHPVSTNTVPAGLFKNLISSNGESEERTRRVVRSRLSSRDVFEHSPQQSLDDFHVAPISHRISRNRLFTEPAFRDGSMYDEGPRRSSLPPRRARSDSLGSDISIPPVSLTRRLEMQQYEQRLEALLEDKLDEIKGSLLGTKYGAGLSPSNATEGMLNDVVAMFRSQLQESLARLLEDSRMDARGEFDFDLLKGILDQNQAETRAMMRRDIADLLQARHNETDVGQIVEDLSNRTMNAVVGATSSLAKRLQAVESARPASERESIVRDLLNALVPHLSALRPEPIDYDGLTVQLTQAVKPHISQLIDLASDKRETAGLIVDKLVPILPSIHPPAPELDMESIVGRLSTEIRKIIGPLDAHEMKEQVSDLVVERLDSRLAVRDRALNVDMISEKVAEHVRGLAIPIQELRAAMDAIRDRESGSTSAQFDISALRNEIGSILSDLPQKLGAATEALGAAHTEFKVKAERLDQLSTPTVDLTAVESALDGIQDEHKKLVLKNQEFSEFCQDIINHINALPETMLKATEVLQNAHADFASRDTSKKDSDEIRRLMNANAELQVQVAKARGAHGQVRVEKDTLSERVKGMEAERDRTTAQMQELQDVASTKTAEAATVEAKNVELEQALARALERLKAADVQAQGNHERILQLEKQNHELGHEKQQLKSKVDSLEIRSTFMAREQENVLEELANQRKQYDELLHQQSHWEDLRRTSEQIQMLTNLVGQADSEEIKELRRIRDRSKVLEGEQAALQRRLKELESKAANTEKVAQASRQSLVQAQQRASEWEHRAKEYEMQLEQVQSKLDQTEEARAQIDSDYSLTKLQLDERDAEERLDKDRQNKLRDQIASLEAQVARLQAEVDQSKKATTLLAPQPQQPRYQNGHVQPSLRPTSRSSTVWVDSRAATPTVPQQNGMRTPSVRASSPPVQGVWDSMHAPKNRAQYQQPIRLPVTPRTKHASPYYRPQIPSPTPSNVSAAPTLGDDGWWQ
ncbi:hypothetical protein CERSUDRAFT_79057 [Gelatoporia subvermispora B]|uniref:Uncharacterized protein n=1 Tax=Ceriporiopsis subvermispora (strain B) TaxID=914234 RepID=M2RSL3_CERS8|nr:hypothetical protein CERSUDRAFT_79057 [Gelatoporia subvermispora B]